MDTILQDLRYAVRMLLKSPGTTFVAILALTAGIGANTAIFSVVNAVLLQPLPYSEPERLVNIWSGRTGDLDGRSSISYADFVDWRRDGKSFERIAAWNYNNAVFRSGSEPLQLRGIASSADLLPMLGVKPELGRFYTNEDDVAGAAPVIVLSHSAWQKHFGGKSDVVGSSVMLGSTASTVIGVAPDGFVFPATWRSVDFFTPIVPTIGELATQRSSQFLKCVAQLRSDVTVEAARAEMAGMCQRLATAYPDTNTDRSARMVTMQEDLVGDSRPALLVLLGAVALVLLIACANVANLLLVRATARQRELSIRAALGAGRSRIAQQLLVESLVLSVIGAGAGMILAVWGLDTLLRFSPGNIPFLRNARLDPLVLGFTLVVTLVTTLVAGIAPAIALSRPDLSDALKEGTRGSTEGAGPRRIRSALVGLQFALSVMLLVGAGLLIRSFAELRNVNPGFDASGVYAIRLNPDKGTYPEPDDANRYLHQVVDAVRATSGVETAALIGPLPFSGWSMSSSFAIDGQADPPPGQEPVADSRFVSGDFFRTMRIPLVQGRAIDERDAKGAAPVVMVNEAFARKFFPNQETLGQRIVIGADPIDNPNPPVREIVGIVGDSYNEGLDVKPGPAYYVPYEQDDIRPLSVVVRGSGLTVAGLREAVRSVDRNEYIELPLALDASIADSIEGHQFNTMLLGLFAFVALLLATVGIYGVMAYAVARRTHEIGIRMALGASAGRILRDVVGQGLGMAVVGTVIGLVGAFALSRALESLLFGVSATDPSTFVVVTGLLLLVALLACYLPARWASRVDPMIALRDE